MKLIRKLDDITDDLRGCALSIGNFDGVHLGHARIMERLVVRSHEVAGPSIVFTFDPHPVRILRPKLAPPPLTWTERKAQLLTELGVEFVVAYPTDAELLSLRATEFFDWIVCEQFAARAIVEGANFFFGKDREGSVTTLEHLCRKVRIPLDIVEPVRSDNELVSSSRVRGLVREGNVAQACQNLTRPYRIRGMVTHGEGRGAKMGFPTANLEAIDTLLPFPGVYAGRAVTATGTWPAGINIGPNLTFNEAVAKVEVHLVGFEGTLYGQVLEVDFLARLRDIQAFDSTEELVKQLNRDMDETVKTVAKS